MSTEHYREMTKKVVHTIELVVLSLGEAGHFEGIGCHDHDSPSLSNPSRIRRVHKDSVELQPIGMNRYLGRCAQRDGFGQRGDTALDQTLRDTNLSRPAAAAADDPILGIDIACNGRSTHATSTQVVGYNKGERRLCWSLRNSCTVFTEQAKVGKTYSQWGTPGPRPGPEHAGHTTARAISAQSVSNWAGSV